jgi:hypothetical protein
VVGLAAGLPGILHVLGIVAGSHAAGDVCCKWRLRIPAATSPRTSGWERDRVVDPGELRVVPETDAEREGEVVGDDPSSRWAPGLRIARNSSNPPSPCSTMGASFVGVAVLVDRLLSS